MIYWRKPSEWASKLYEWVDGSGQVDTVLTLYELREGDVTEGTGVACANTRTAFCMLKTPARCPSTAVG